MLPTFLISLSHSPSLFLILQDPYPDSTDEERQAVRQKLLTGLKEALAGAYGVKAEEVDERLMVSSRGGRGLGFRVWRGWRR